MTAYGALVAVHALAGAIGLLSMVVTLVAAKGTRSHRRVGGLFASAMAVTSATGLLIALVLTGAPEMARPEASEAGLEQLRTAGVFFAVISLVTGQAVAVGVLASRNRRRNPSRHPLSHAINVALGMASVGALIVGLPTMHPYLLVAGGLGLVNAIRSARPKPQPWLRTHIEAMLGGCTAATTAFTVQTVTRLSPESLVAALAWTVPVALGMFATAVWTRRLRTRKMVLDAG